MMKIAKILFALGAVAGFALLLIGAFLDKPTTMFYAMLAVISASWGFSRCE